MKESDKLKEEWEELKKQVLELTDKCRHLLPEIARRNEHIAVLEQQNVALKAELARLEQTITRLREVCRRYPKERNVTIAEQEEVES